MDGTFLFLGTGASTGVPVVGCDCTVCRSNSSANKRLRSSGLIKCGDKVFLIDCGPDFREQALRYRIDRLDALFLTHTHYDHIAGIDDLRGLFFHKNAHLPFLLSEESFRELKKHYDYLFDLKSSRSWGKHLQIHLLADRGMTDICGLTLKYFSYVQCGMKVTGYRMGDFAYVTDICKDSDEIIDVLQGVQQLVISAISNTASNAHFSVDQAVAFAKKIQARQAWLTHIGHHINHDEVSAFLPPNIQLGYDGLEFKISL